jgi:hypothetical protein
VNLVPPTVKLIDGTLLKELLGNLTNPELLSTVADGMDLIQVL